MISSMTHVIGDSIFEPNPSDLYTLTRIELSVSHAAGVAPLPWLSPCRILRMSPPMHLVESPHPVRRKHFMSWIERSMAAIAPVRIPIQRKIMAMMAWWTMP